MSALPAEVPPSGAPAARPEIGRRGRSTTAGAPARPLVHPLFPGKRLVLPDGDCIFPGGGDHFSAQAAPRTRRLPARPADGRPVAGRHPVPGPRLARAGDGTPDGRLAGPGRSAAVRAGEAVSPGRLRLTRRGRIVVAALAALGACGLFVAGASAAQASGPAGRGAARQVIVQPGDTLWSIAQRAAPDADARAVVQQILQANRLATASITAGQRLWMPRG